MADENKDVIDAETVEVKDQEKKEGKFGKWWKGVKKDFADSALEAKIETVWDNAHEKFEITPFNGGIFGCQPVYGTIEDNRLIVFGTYDAEPYSVVISSKDKKAFYALSSTPTTLKVACDGIEYEREGRIIVLDPNVKEVKVIKADGRYFTYLGNKF